jgi:type VI protein secretion system component VasK
MKLMLKRLRTYVKLVLVVAVAVAVVLIILYNRNHRVTFWFFGTYENVNVLWLLLCTAAGAIITYWVALTVFSLWKELREMGRESARRASEEEQRRREAELAEQERRIDAKRAEMLREEP